MQEREGRFESLANDSRQNKGVKLFSLFVRESDRRLAQSMGIPYAVCEFLAARGIKVSCSEEMYKVLTGEQNVLIVATHNGPLDVYSLVAAQGAVQKRWFREGGQAIPGGVAGKKVLNTLWGFGAPDFLFSFANGSSTQEGFPFSALCSKDYALDNGNRALEHLFAIAKKNPYFLLYMLLDRNMLWTSEKCNRVNEQTLRTVGNALAEESTIASIFVDGSYYHHRNKHGSETPCRKFKSGIIDIFSYYLTNEGCPRKDLVILPWQTNFPYSLPDFMAAIAGFSLGKPVTQTVGSPLTLEQAFGDKIGLFEHYRKAENLKRQEIAKKLISELKSNFTQALERKDTI